MQILEYGQAFDAEASDTLKSELGIMRLLFQAGGHYFAERMSAQI